MHGKILLDDVTHLESQFITSDDPSAILFQHTDPGCLLRQTWIQSPDCSGILHHFLCHRLVTSNVSDQSTEQCPNSWCNSRR